VVLALLSDLQVEVPEIPVVPMREMTVEVSALFAKSDQVVGIKFEFRRQVERFYMMYLQTRGCPAPLAFGLFGKMFFFYAMPFGTSQTSRLAPADVMDKLEMSLHLRPRVLCDIACYVTFDRALLPLCSFACRYSFADCPCLVPGCVQHLIRDLRGHFGLRVAQMARMLDSKTCRGPGHLLSLSPKEKAAPACAQGRLSQFWLPQR
jgi:hypothetical protein